MGLAIYYFYHKIATKNVSVVLDSILGSWVRSAVADLKSAMNSMHAYTLAKPPFPISQK